MNITIQQVSSQKDYNQFIAFPHDLYAKDKHYVPAVNLAVKELLSPKKNPFFKHSKADLFLALQEGQVVGRIAAIRNNNYNDFHQCQVGFFGFFEVVEQYEVAKMLLDIAVQWMQQEDLKVILGPTNFTTNDTAGLLVEGFGSPPVVEMTYNKPYYAHFLERYGFTKEMDLLAWWLPTQGVSERPLKVAERIAERLQKQGIHFRALNMKKFSEEVAAVKEVYRSAWEKNWGFVPPTDQEFDHLAEGLKLVLDARYNFIAEHNGKMIGFAIGLPNINEVLIKNKRGRLLPFGWLRLLWGKKKVKIIRIILLGVLADYRKMGIEGVFFANYIRAAKANGLIAGEASWVLENNDMMQQAAKKLNGKPYKTYRIYRLDILN